MSVQGLSRSLQQMARATNVQTAQVEREKKLDQFASVITAGGKNGVEVDMKAVSAKENARLEKLTKLPKDNIEKAQKAKEAVSTLKQLATNLESSVKSLLAPVGQSSAFDTPTVQFPANSPLDGIASITLNANATVGSPTLQVNQIASKQKYVIGAVDGVGSKKTVPFAGTSKNQIFTATGLQSGNLAFIDKAKTAINVPLTGNEDLYGVSTLINNSVDGVESYVEGNQHDGYFLVIESTEAGTKNSFQLRDYLPAYEVKDSDGNPVGGAGHTFGPYGSTALINVATAVPLSSVQYVDIYRYDGAPFLDSMLFDADTKEDASFKLVPVFDAEGVEIGQSTTFYFGGYSVTSTMDDGLEGIATAINGLSQPNVRASVIKVSGGYALRIEAATGSLPPEFFSSPGLIKTQQGKILIGQQLKIMTAQDTQVLLDGKPLPPSASTTLANPSSDIASINVTGTAPLSSFSIIRDKAGMEEAIHDFVTSYNEAQQFIAQQSQKDINGLPDEDAVLYRDSALRSLKNKLSSITSISVGGMTLADLGIKKYQFQGDIENGLVPATYLKVTDTTLSAQLLANFTGVQDLFSGAIEAPSVDVNIPDARDSSIGNIRSTTPGGGAIALASDDGSLGTVLDVVLVASYNSSGDISAFTIEGQSTYLVYNAMAGQYVVTGRTPPYSSLTLRYTPPPGGLSNANDEITFDYTSKILGEGGHVSSIVTFFDGFNGNDPQFISGSLKAPNLCSLDCILAHNPAGAAPILSSVKVMNGTNVGGYNLQVTSRGGSLYYLTGDGSANNPFNDFTISYDTSAVFNAPQSGVIQISFQSSTQYVGRSDSEILLVNAPSNFNISKFDIKVSNTNDGYIVKATNKATGQGYDLKFTPIGTTGGIISDPTYKTPFGGVIMQYTLPTGGIAVGESDNIAGITYSPGIATTLDSYLEDYYLDPTSGAVKSAQGKYEGIEKRNEIEVERLENQSERRIIEIIQKLIEAELKFNRFRTFLEMFTNGKRG